MRDIINSLAFRQSIAPAVQAAAINGTGIDILGFGSLGFIIDTGAVVGAGDFGVKLQESDDNSTFADVAAAQVQSTVPATLVANSVYELGYLGFKRYVRPAVTKAGGTSLALGATAVLGHAGKRPAV